VIKSYLLVFALCETKIARIKFTYTVVITLESNFILTRIVRYIESCCLLALGLFSLY